MKSLLVIMFLAGLTVVAGGFFQLFGPLNPENYLTMLWLGIIVFLTMLGSYEIWMELQTFAGRMAGTKDHSVNTDQD